MKGVGGVIILMKPRTYDDSDSTRAQFMQQLTKEREKRERKQKGKWGLLFKFDFTWCRGHPPKGGGRGAA